jgi:hypothetical protein
MRGAVPAAQSPGAHIDAIAECTPCAALGAEVQQHSIDRRRGDRGPTSYRCLCATRQITIGYRLGGICTYISYTCSRNANDFLVLTGAGSTYITYVTYTKLIV